MRIGFTGAQGTGKSTLLKEMFGWPEFDGHSFISGLTRAQIKRDGVSFNEGGNYVGQLHLTKTMSWHLKTLQNMVVDRTLLDIYSYTVYHRDHGTILSHQLNDIRDRCRERQHLFDVVFYIRPEFELKEDGLRSPNKEFAAEMASIMDHTVRYEPLGTRHIITLTGSVENRLAIIKGWLNENTI